MEEVNIGTVGSSPIGKRFERPVQTLSQVNPLMQAGKLLDITSVKVDPESKLFARAMETLTKAGIITLIITGVLYFARVKDMVSLKSVTQNWDKSAPDFWQATTGVKADGYAWFANHLSYMDNLTIMGVAFLALIPLLCIGIAISKASTRCKFVFGILMIELVFAIVRPLIMGGGG